MEFQVDHLFGLAGFIWIVVQMIVMGKKRDRELAVWQTSMEKDIELIQSQIPIAEVFLKELARVQDHIDRKLEKMSADGHAEHEKLEATIKEFTREAREGRKDLHKRVDHAEERIDNLKK